MAAIQHTGGFDDRFLSKLSKVDQQGIETFLTKLVHEKRFLQVVFKAMLEGLVVLRPNLEVLYINNAAVELLGITRRQRIYREHFASLVDVPEFQELLSRFALKHEKLMYTEIEMPAPSHRWLSVSIMPLDEEFNVQPGAAVMIIHDNTEVRMAQQEREKLERATTLARLTTSLAHEIKNPLNSLQIHAQLLNRAVHDKKSTRTDRDRVRKSSDIILEELSRLSEVVNNFLTAMRPTRPIKDKADINRLIEHVYATVQPELEARGIACVLRLDRDIPLVHVDTAQITQAVLNLLKNSMEALDEQREELQVQGRSGMHPPQPWKPAMEVSTRIADAHYLIRVQDNGPGIPDENLDKILEPYYTTKFSGTGLGLAIVSRIVEEHGGRMEISSRAGAGTAVSISLPMNGRPVRLLEDQSDGEAHELLPSDTQ
jgi:nitrogen fixation/metabolism regulation signal transduction histidine kinase